MIRFISSAIRVLICVGILFIGFHQDGFSQENPQGFLVTGKVNNSQGEKAAGAVILIKGTTTGTVTNIDGFFSIKVPSKESILVISHFSTSKSTEVSLSGDVKVVVLLDDDSKDLTMKTESSDFNNGAEKPKSINTNK